MDIIQSLRGDIARLEAQVANEKSYSAFCGTVVFILLVIMVAIGIGWRKEYTRCSRVIEEKRTLQIKLADHRRSHLPF